DLFTKCRNHRIVEEEYVERVVPPAVVGPMRRISIVLHETVGQLLERLIELRGAPVAQIDPRREQRHHSRLDLPAGRGLRDALLTVIGCHWPHDSSEKRPGAVLLSEPGAGHVVSGETTRYRYAHRST